MFPSLLNKNNPSGTWKVALYFWYNYALLSFEKIKRKEWRESR